MKKKDKTFFFEDVLWMKIKFKISTFIILLCEWKNFAV